MTKDERQLDLICMGRAAVDFYAQQIGARLEDVRSFAKYLGGSSCNVAYGAARLGLRSSMLAKVGDDHMGRFLREELERVGVDTSSLITDRERLTGLVILGIEDKETFPLLFYRTECADMGIRPDDVNEDYIASARALAITGTHLSHPETRAAVLTALQYAAQHGLKRILDIDYRPVLWGLTSLADGETRYVASPEVSAELQEVLGHFDLIVGTEEEIHIAGGSTDTLAAIRKVRECAPEAVIVCKRGATGCSVFEGAIPDSLDGGINVLGVRVEVLNVLGAGDAFLAGFLRGYLEGEPWTRAGEFANACGALVVSRHGCAPAMPSRIELDDYMARRDDVRRPDLDDRLRHLHRVTTRERDEAELQILSFEQRQEFIELARESNADLSRMPRLKELLYRAVQDAEQSDAQRYRRGLIIDGRFGADVLNTASGTGMWLARPIELPGSRPLVLESGDVGTTLTSWPTEQVVRCQLCYHPDDDPMLRIEQERCVQEINAACMATGHRLLIEQRAPAGMAADDEQHLRTVTRFYNLNIRPDWWQFPPLSLDSWRALAGMLDERDPFCEGILLGAGDSSLDEFRTACADTTGIDRIRGFTAGWTTTREPAAAWLAAEIDDDTLVERVASNYHSFSEAWRNR